MLVDVTGRNVNHIIPPFCHLPDRYRSLVVPCSTLGGCNKDIIYIYIYTYRMTMFSHLSVPKVLFIFILLDSLHYARNFHLLEFLAEAFRCHVQDQDGQNINIDVSSPSPIFSVVVGVLLKF